MKPTPVYLLLLGCLGYLPALTAQPLEHLLTHGYRTELLNLVATDDGFLAATYPFGTSSYFDLHHFDPTGHLTWEKSYSFFPNVYSSYTNALHVLPLRDSTAILLFEPQDWDVNGQSVLLRISATGDTVWTRLPGDETFYFDLLMPTSDTSFWVLSSSGWLPGRLFSIAGTELPLPTGNLPKHALRLPDGYLFANATTVWKAEFDGTPTGPSFTSFVPITRLDTTPAQQVAVFSSQGVTLLDATSLSIQAQYPLPANFTQRPLLLTADGYAFLRQNNTTRRDSLFYHNWAGVVQNSVDVGNHFQYSWYSNVPAIVRRDSVLAIASGLRNDAWVGFGNDQQDWNVDPDLAITQVRVAGPATAKTYYNWGGAVYDVRYEDVYCTVVNRGSVPIDSWKTSYFTFGSFVDGYYETIYNQTLAPGDSVEVLFKSVLQCNCAIQGFPGDLCLTVHEVNHGRDNNYADNYRCDPTPDIVVVGTSEVADLSKLLYPNPTSEWLYLQGLHPDEGLQFDIFDLSGRNLLTGRWSGDGIQVATLPPGLYVLRLVGPDGRRMVGRFVVQ